MKVFGYSSAVSALADITKEVYNNTKPTNNFDSADVAATVVGSLTASVTLSLFVCTKKKIIKLRLLTN